jgi:phosphatidylinositol alpha 1,6-mannosyltransferase
VRIVHVSDCYAPRTGGIETQVQALAERQRREGHEVHVITATPSDPTGEKTGASGVTLHRVTMRLPFDLPLHLRARARVREVLQSITPDIAHVHVGAVSPFVWGAVRAAHECDVPVLATVHSMWGPLARSGYRLSDVLLRWSNWGVTLSAVSTPAAMAIARSVRASADHVLVLPNGIDVDEWQVEQRPSLDAPFQLVTVMRLAPRKRLLPLLRILERARANADVRLTIIGDGPERARGERAARRLPVRFTGRLSASEIRQEFASADAFIQPSVRESFGIAALEARVAGLPVIARSQTGTAGFITDGGNGLLARSDAAMTAAVVRLANDPSAVARMRAWNREHRPEQEWRTVLAAVDEAYGVSLRV